MATYFWVSIGSSNGLLPDGTNPLPEPMLTYHQWNSVVPTWDQFHTKCSRYQFVKWQSEKCTCWIISTSLWATILYLGQQPTCSGTMVPVALTTQHNQLFILVWEPTPLVCTQSEATNGINSLGPVISGCDFKDQGAFQKRIGALKSKSS